MSKCCCFVIGKAGAGKSTFCEIMQKHMETKKRTLHVFNLDPAADHFNYVVSADVRELISVEDVMQVMDYGPNGALMYCMEYLLQNLDWLRDEIQDFAEDYLMFDCPGQIELYQHTGVMEILTSEMSKIGYSVCTIYCMDALFTKDPSRFLSASLVCLSSMIRMETPHINVITKCDLIKDTDSLNEFLDQDPEDVAYEVGLNDPFLKKFKDLTTGIADVLMQYPLVSYVPLNCTEKESLNKILMLMDVNVQYGENAEINEKDVLEEFGIKDD